jgi:ABC-type lipoprotein release transport system permease subunit
MSYAHLPVSQLLKGPLLHTPQGWVVLASIGIYLGLACLLWLGFIAPPAGKNIEASVVACLFWPLITFLFFVKTNLPDFQASWSKTFLVAVAALAPIAYACIYG